MPEVLCHEYVCICLRSQIKSFLAVISYYRPIFCCVLVNWYMLQSNHSFRHLIFHLGIGTTGKRRSFWYLQLWSLYGKNLHSLRQTGLHTPIFLYYFSRGSFRIRSKTLEGPLQKRAQKDLAL